LDDLSRREYFQLSIGNVLLHCAITLIVESIPCLASGVLEHPACPEEDHYPSIWKLLCMRRLAGHDDSHQFTFSQGLLGQASRKDTRLHAVRLPMLQRFISEFSDRRLLRASAASPLEADGSFATAKLKTYPPRLNACFLLSFLHQYASPLFEADDLDDLIADAKCVLLARCDFIRVNSGDGSFVEQAIPASALDSDLSAYADWPERHATIGRDFAF
jgi:hypothetical protein